MAGPQGRDAGLALAFPIACYISHALNGLVVEGIHEFITILTESYLDNVIEPGMECNKKAALYRNIIGWGGLCVMPILLLCYSDRNFLC
jgi:hypothetical protein